VANSWSTTSAARLSSLVVGESVIKC
jgi:hypothetical protein